MPLISSSHADDPSLFDRPDPSSMLFSPFSVFFAGSSFCSCCCIDYNRSNNNIDNSMFGVHLAEKKQKEGEQRRKEESREKHWLKKYHSEIKPKLLERYDTRVNAFIRQLEEAPTDKNKLLKHHHSVHFRPFKFATPSPNHTPSARPANPSTQDQLHASMADISSGIRRSSQYVPLSSYQFRERQKEKELRPKLQMKVIRYRKWQKESQQIGRLPREDGQLSRMSAREFFRRVPEDNRSEIPSLYDDNQSLRFSVNDNIEGEARQYEKQQELVERKNHFKRLANLQQVVQDPRAKRSIHELLVKGGFTKPKIKTENEEAEVDQLRLELEKESKI